MAIQDKTERVLLDVISKLGLLEWKRYLTLRYVYL